MSMNYLELSVSDLRDQCKQRNLEFSGLKVHLVERLKKYDKDIQMIELAKEAEKKVIEPMSESNSEAIIVEDIKVKPLPSVEIKKPQSPAKVVIKAKPLLERVMLEPENWECRTDVHLDFYNSDLYLVIDPSGYSAEPICESGFEYLFAGVKGNYGLKTGKVYYEVKIIKRVNVNLVSDAGDANCIKVGWSADNTSLALGEEQFSFGLAETGKKSSNNITSDYGRSFKENDVVGCFLEFIDESFIIHFSVNGVNQGEAFKGNSNDLKDQILLPHISARNINFEVNFGHDQEAFFKPKTVNNVDDLGWTQLGKVEIDDRIRALCPPKSKSDCEVLMMCGLPSCGKTTWVEKMVKNNAEKFYNVLSTNVILDKMKVAGLRKKCTGSRWDTFLQSATQCLSKMMEIAVTRRRNFILDQTNVYPTAQRRRMKTFEEFIRKAIIVVPTDDEYQRRMNQVVTEEGKDVPESAVLQMKENFVIPEETSDLFKEIRFVELERPEAEVLVKKYNDEARTKRKNEEHNNIGKRSERAESSSAGERGSSPKKSEADTSSQSSSKKSRWNEERSEESSKYTSKPSSRDYGSKSSSTSHTSSSRKNEYKGGFCFAREEDDTDKSTSGRGSGARPDDRKSDRDRSRGRDQRDDRYGSSRSGGDRGSGSRFGQSDDRSRGRSRERVSSDRRSNSGYNDSQRDHNNSSGGGSGNRGGRFQPPSYGGADRFNAGGQQERPSRFQDKVGPSPAGGSFAATKFNYGGAQAGRAANDDYEYQSSQTEPSADFRGGQRARGGASRVLGWNGGPQTDAAYGQPQYGGGKAQPYGGGKVGPASYGGGGYQGYDMEEESAQPAYGAPIKPAAHQQTPFKAPLPSSSYTAKDTFKAPPGYGGAFKGAATAPQKAPIAATASQYGLNKGGASVGGSMATVPAARSQYGSAYGGSQADSYRSGAGAAKGKAPVDSYNDYSTPSGAEADDYYEGAQGAGYGQEYAGGYKSAYQGYGAASQDGYSAPASSTGPASYGSASGAGYDVSTAAGGYGGASTGTYGSASSGGGGYKAAISGGYNNSSASVGYKSGTSSAGYNSSTNAGGYNSSAAASGYNSGASAGGYNSASNAGGYNNATASTDYNSSAAAEGYGTKEFGAASTGGSGYGASATGGSGYGASTTGGSGYGASTTGGSAYGASTTGGSAYGASTTGGSASGTGGRGYGAAATGVSGYDTAASGGSSYGSSATGASGYGVSTTGGSAYGASGTGASCYGAASTGGAGYGAASTGGYGSTDTGGYGFSATGGYGSSTTGGSGYGAAATGGGGYGATSTGAYNTGTGASGYNNSGNGPYSSTAAAASAVVGGSGAQQYGKTQTAAGGYNSKGGVTGKQPVGGQSQTYSNPYSTCYDYNSSGTGGGVAASAGGYESYGGQGAASASYGNQKAVEPKAAAAVTSSAPAARAYGDYSQYYQSYGQQQGGYGN